MPSVVVVTPTSGGMRVEISETLSAPTDEVQITGMPVNGVVVRQECILTGAAVGGAATVDPILGWATNPQNQQVICENDEPEATVDNAGEAPYSSELSDAVGSSTCTLFHRSRVNGGTASITTRYLIRPTW